MLYIFFLLSVCYALRKPLIVYNWKAYFNNNDITGLSKNIKNLYINNIDVCFNKEIVILVPYIYIYQLKEIFINTPFSIGAQYVSSETSGPYAGEITSTMLKSLSCKFCLVGHFEYKYSFHNKYIHRTIFQLLSHNIIPLFSLTDTYEHFINNNSINYCLSRIDELYNFLSIYNLPIHLYSNIVFIYDPNWNVTNNIMFDKIFLDKLYFSIKNHIIAKYNFNPVILYNNKYHNSSFDGSLVSFLSFNEFTFFKYL